MAHAIRTDRITKRFRTPAGFWDVLNRKGTEVTAVDGVSLEVGEGEVFGLLGVNGAGKTTLVKMLSTLVIPNSGEGWIFGKSLLRQSHEVRRLISLVTPDERSFYWRLTGRRNLQFVAEIYQIPRSEVPRRIGELAECLGMERYLDVRFSNYSTGMRQKLAMARGLLAKSRLLFMDEPTKGLDPIASAELLDLIGKEIIPRYGITVLMTTHILREAEILCDRVAIIDGGKIVACDAPSRLQRSFSEFEIYSVKLRAADAGFIDLIRKVEGVVDVAATPLPNDEIDLELRLREGSEALSAILALVAGSPSRVLSCTRQTASLDDSFSAIVRGERNGKEVG